VEHILRIKPAKEVEQAGDHTGPTGLMAGAETRSVIPVKIFIKEDVVSPVRIFLKLG
jgi:hypothetical protein